ncbi:MAG: transposase, partial [Myxococcota bacterium]
NRGIAAVIPPRSLRLKKRRFDTKLYELRYLVECFFHSIKRFRRIATRYDKNARCYKGFLMLACAMQWV